LIAEKRLIARYFSHGRDMFQTESDLLTDAYIRRGEEINYVERRNDSVTVREEPLENEH